MARRKFVCGNWKMHRTVAEAVALAKDVAAGLAQASGGKVQVAVAPPFTALHAVAAAVKGTGVEVAAQNVHWEAQGAFTGEISAAMLAEAGCRHGIVGHAWRPRRQSDTGPPTGLEMLCESVHLLGRQPDPVVGTRRDAGIGVHEYQGSGALWVRRSEQDRHGHQGRESGA